MCKKRRGKLRKLGGVVMKSVGSSEAIKICLEIKDPGAVRFYQSVPEEPFYNKIKGVREK